MNYFEFFEIPMSFRPDAAALKKKFYANSKKYHPDFYATESDEKQAEILELSTLNNEAYKVLKDEDKRMKYILTEQGVYGPEGENKLPQEFLMEMMEINEEIMELQFEYESKRYGKVLQEVEKFEQGIRSEVENILENWTETKGEKEDLERVKNYFLKRRYLLRIKENLSKFAPALREKATKSLCS